MDGLLRGFDVCDFDVCLRGKLKGFIMSNTTLFVRGSSHQGDSRFSYKENHKI